MAVKDQVDSIIAARKKKCEKLKERKQKLEDIKKLLTKYETELVDRTLEIQDDELRTQYGDLSHIDLMSVRKKLKEAIKSMDAVAKRFDRDYISIATIGRERMGKSRLLQSIGGLDARVIPTSDTGSCTGATSVIWNEPDMKEGEVRATLSFRKPEELVNMVMNYLEQLSPGYSENHKIQFDDIGDISLVQFKLSDDQTKATDQNVAKENLRKIVENFDGIKDLFGAPDKILTNPDDIQTFVAQNNGNPLDKGGKEFFNYLAVARADIYCKFYASDIGRVRLVDTIGLGALQYGIEEAMLNTVDAECDTAIVVARPDASGVQDKDVEIYKLLQTHFSNRKIDQWLYYFINHRVGFNDNSTQTWKNDAEKYGWSVADMEIVDASDPEAVKIKFIIPMLESLLKNMNDIDAAYLKEADNKEADFRNELDNFLNGLKPASKVRVNIGANLFQKGTECFDTMTSNLRKQVEEWNLKKNERNNILWNSVQKILNDLENIVPSEEKIQEVIDVNGGHMLPQAVWTNMLHYVRNEVTDRFIAIDNLLEKETVEFKNSLVQVLYDELHGLTGSAQSETDETKEVDKVEWLKTMMDEYLEDDEQFRQIRKAFDFLYQFTFNTRAQLIQEVRRQLYIINPICDEYAMPTYNFHYTDCANAVHFYLTSRISVIEDELRFHLAKLYNTPNQAFYAAAEEFYDRLTFAGDFAENGGLVNMQNVWGFFFQKFGSMVFDDNTKRFEAVNALVESYNKMIQELNVFLKTAQAERRAYGTAD